MGPVFHAFEVEDIAIGSASAGQYGADVIVIFLAKGEIKHPEILVQMHRRAGTNDGGTYLRLLEDIAAGHISHTGTVLVGD